METVKARWSRCDVKEPILSNFTKILLQRGHGHRMGPQPLHSLTWPDVTVPSQVFGELCMGQMVRYGKMPGFTTIWPSALIHFLAVCLSCVQSAPTVLYVGMQVSGWFPFRTAWCHPATLLAPVSWPEWPSPNLWAMVTMITIRKISAKGHTQTLICWTCIDLPPVPPLHARASPPWSPWSW
jgi:hypothetical protein